MKYLAIETSTPGASVAVVEEATTLATASRVDRVGHATFLVPAIDFCFDQVGWSPSDLDAIIVDVGPGLYTGIRVGVATAQGLAAAFGIPIVPAISLDAIALEARTGHRLIWAVVDVRRDEFAVACYRPVPGGVVKEGSIDLVSADVLRARLVESPEESLVVGDVSALPEGFVVDIHRAKVGRPRYPYAVTLAEVGRGRFEKGNYPSPDVTINWEKVRQEGPWGRQ